MILKQILKTLQKKMKKLTITSLGMKCSLNQLLLWVTLTRIIYLHPVQESYFFWKYFSFHSSRFQWPCKATPNIAESHPDLAPSSGSQLKVNSSLEEELTSTANGRIHGNGRATQQYYQQPPTHELQANTSPPLEAWTICETKISSWEPSPMSQPTMNSAFGSSCRHYILFHS